MQLCQDDKDKTTETVFEKVVTQLCVDAVLANDLSSSGCRGCNRTQNNIAVLTKLRCCPVHCCHVIPRTVLERQGSSIKVVLK